MCFAIQVSGIILRPFYSRVRDARRDRISPSLSLNFHQTVTIRATKSNNRPANLLRARQSFVELPSTRTNFLFNSQQNATPSLFIVKSENPTRTVFETIVSFLPSFWPLPLAPPPSPRFRNQNQNCVYIFSSSAHSTRDIHTEGRITRV